MAWCRPVDGLLVVRVYLLGIYSDLLVTYYGPVADPADI